METGEVAEVADLAEEDREDINLAPHPFLPNTQGIFMTAERYQSGPMGAKRGPSLIP